MLSNNKGIVKRWKEYFEGLLNEEFPRDTINRFKWNLGIVDG